MNIFEKFAKSIYGPEFYQQAIKESVWKALGYFAVIILLITTITAAYLAVQMNRGFDSFREPAYTLYPGDLELKIIDGKVSVNKEEPVIIPLKDDFGGSEPYKNLLVIDTKTPFEQSTFNKYQTVMWLTKDSLITKNSSQTRIMDLSQVKDFKINQSIYKGWIDLIFQYRYLIVAALTIILFIFMYLGSLFILIPFLIIAFLFWLIAKKFKPQLSYKQTYVAAIYAGTAGLVVTRVIELVAPHAQLPFLMELIAVVIFLVNFRNQPTVAKKPRKR